jgi:DNA-directed RNA polymerase subunit RPC12/RpoP
MRVCWECGQKVLVKNTAIERTKYPSRKTEYLCKDCKRRKDDEMISRNREELGLPSRNLESDG